MQQRAHPLRVRTGQRRLLEPFARFDTEQVRRRDQHPGLGQHGVHLGLETRADRHDLCPVADQLAQFSNLWWRDPCLGQPFHPKQIRQITGVADVVLHPPVPESLDTQRMRQMHRRARRLQHIDGPVVG